MTSFSVPSILSAQSSRSRRILVSAGIVTTSVAVAAIVLAGALGIFIVHTQGRIDGAIAALAEAGYPVEPETIRAIWGPAGEFRDAREELGRIRERLTERRTRSPRVRVPDKLKLDRAVMQDLLGVGYFLETENAPVEAWRSYLAENAAALEELMTTLEAGPIRFQTNSIEPARMLTGGYRGELAPFADLLECECRVACIDGDAERAVRAIEGLIQLGASFEGSPLFDAQMAKLGVWRVAQVCLAGTLSSVNPNDDQLQRLAEGFRRVSASDAMPVALPGQYGGTLLDGRNTSIAKAVMAPLEMLDRARRLESYAQLARDWAEPPPLRWSRLHDRLEAARVAIMEAADKKNKDRLGTDKAAADITWDVATNARMLLYAQYFFNASEVAIAVVQHYHHHGAWPASVETISPELLPEQPVDEITGAPFLLVYHPDGFAVVSPGPNGDDESAATSGSIVEMYRTLDFLYNDDFVLTVRTPGST